MARMWIVVGDTTSGGGSVVAGSPFTAVDGKPVARIGDAVACSRHGPTTIVSGDATILIDGQALARHGDSCACGCTLLAVAQSRAFIDPGAAAGGGAAAGPSAGGAGAASNTAQALAAATPGPARAAGQEAANEEDPVPEVSAIELAPEVVDEDDNAIDGSTATQGLGHRHPMVEEAPNTNRIAHREVKIRVCSDGQPAAAFQGRTVTWTMVPRFVPPEAEEAVFRGAWAQAAQAHRDRFEASATFGAHGFARVGQESATTTVDADGNSAIRVNLPPIAFNAARISVQVDGMDEPAELIDLEVPGVVVLDPGHGGTENLPGSDADHAQGASSGVHEKDLTLDFCRRVRTRLRALRTGENENLKIYMTRDADVNIAGSARANVGRDRGADILMSIHFNGFNGRARGTETWVRRESQNVNMDEDEALARRINDAVYNAVLAHDENASDRGIKEGGWAVVSDASLGNSADFHPLRSILMESEFIDNQAVDDLLNNNENHAQVRQDIADAIADALLEDLRRNP